MLYIPIVDTIVTQPTLSSEKNTEPLFNFERFKLNQIKKFPQSPTSRTNNSTRLNPVRNTVAFGSSQERKKAEKTILPPLHYNLNFRSVDKHQASPILRTNRTNRIKSEISQTKCTHCMITIQRTEACAQSMQQNQENYIARLIQKAKTPKKEIQPKVQLQFQEFIPMSSKQLKESLKSLMLKYGLQKA